MQQKFLLQYKAMALKANWLRTGITFPLGQMINLPAFFIFSLIISKMFSGDLQNQIFYFIRVLFPYRIFGNFCFLTVPRGILTSCRLSLILLHTTIFYTTSLPFSNTFFYSSYFFLFSQMIPQVGGTFSFLSQHIFVFVFT